MGIITAISTRVFKELSVFNSQKALGTLLGKEEEPKMCQYGYFYNYFPQSGAALCSMYLITFYISNDTTDGKTFLECGN